jgi:hypothetical protein
MEAWPQPLPTGTVTFLFTDIEELKATAVHSNC